MWVCSHHSTSVILADSLTVYSGRWGEFYNKNKGEKKEKRVVVGLGGERERGGGGRVGWGGGFLMVVKQRMYYPESTKRHRRTVDPVSKIVVKECSEKT